MSSVRWREAKVELSNDILKLTAAVETAIDDGDWLAAGDFDRQRQALLHALLAERSAADLDAETRQTLQQVLARNEASISRLAEQRGELIGTQQRLRRGAVAVRAYTDTGGVRPGE